ncbi:MAG TPA: RHS repeat-associated core domain-containing protein [Chthonomonadales bacterium]|nr:RHS repeat-associated core domain-containing protein [Chthonomonadales bacterium]
MSVSMPLALNVSGTKYAAGISGAVSGKYDGQDHLIEENSRRATTSGGGNDFYLGQYDDLFSDAGHLPDGADNLLRFDLEGSPATLYPTYNFDNQLTNNTYDGDGSPTSYGNASLTFNSLSQITQFGNSPTYFTAGYRTDGLRGWKLDSSSSNGPLCYLYDGDRAICELNSVGTVVTEYGYGAAGLLDQYSTDYNYTAFPAPRNFYTFTFDPEGNVSQRSSNANVLAGQLADYTTMYSAFGTQLGSIDVNNEQETAYADAVGFGGQWGYYTDNVTAPAPNGGKPVFRRPVVLLGLRYYDPSVGRFITRDPIDYDGGINLYAYLDDNPINGADPLGTDGWFSRIGGALKSAAKTVVHAVGTVVTYPFKLAWAGIKKLTAVKMDPRTPTLQSAWVDPDDPEYGLRFKRAGKAISKYIDDTAVLVLSAVVPLGKLGLSREGWLTDGSYIVNEYRMAPHLTGSFAEGKSQFLFDVNARDAVLRAAEYADRNGLWTSENTAKVLCDRDLGVSALTGLRTRWLNLYRTQTGFIHGCPGNPP